MYTVTFYSKYNYNNSVSISGVSEMDIHKIKKSFEKQEIINQNFDKDNINFKSQINLANMAYVEYKKE